MRRMSATYSNIYEMFLLPSFLTVIKKAYSVLCSFREIGIVPVQVNRSRQKSFSSGSMPNLLQNKKSCADWKSSLITE